MSLSHYKDSLGEPNKGFHTHFFGFAIGDLLATIAIAFLITLYIKQYVDISHSLLFGIILLILLLVAEYLHKLFGVKNDAH
jgi:hypothetical protein